jgi:glycosyltransferase involved in cell wall biosynthesis
LAEDFLEPTAKRKLEETTSSPFGGGLAAGVDLSQLKVALVHDFLYTYAGAERVLTDILEVLPQADLFSLFDFLEEGNRGFLKGKKSTTSFLQKLPLVRKNHRWFLPLMPMAVESLDVSEYDLVISSSNMAAKGVITSPHQLHICYCHSPARFAWDQQKLYLEQSGIKGGLRGMLAQLMLHYIRGWDVRSAHGVDVFLANSQFVRHRIEKAYRRDATTIYPPVDVEQFALQAVKEDFYVTASRLVPYKRVDIIVQAFAKLPEKSLVVIGSGPELARIRRLATPNVRVLGQVPNETITDCLRRARGFIFAAEEDFGIVPVEAMACGTPVIAYGRGGATETVIPGITGILFPKQTAESLLLALERFEVSPWDAAQIRRHAEQFSRDSFRRAFRHEIATAWALFQNRRGSAMAKLPGSLFTSGPEESI